MRAHQPSTGWRLLLSRWLVLAVMALALPMQGALAVTMQVCGPAPVSAPASLEAVSVHTGHDDQSAHAGHAGHHAGMDHSAHYAASAPAAHTADHDGPSHHDTAHKCSICAQCCVGAAMPMNALTVADVRPAEALPAAAPTALIQRAPRSLDRPPKSFLA